jgi:peptidoglycan hydrolase-like protein with peptidoglycan-binding domain
MQTKFAKIAGLTVGMTFAFGAFVAPASAQTIAELQAQINALMAQLAALQGGSSVGASANFTADLTVGSTGSQVVALQQMLVAQGHLVMPQGVAMGYFGPLTRAAVARWQAANGVAPAVGYWGPISRARANASATGTVPGSTVGSGTTVGGTITTPGVEGTITARLASTPTGVKLREGDTRKAVMGIELEAKTSDIRVERIKLNLGSDTNIYRKIATRLYVMDGSTVLATMDLNADTVIKEGSDYFVTVSGLNFVVPKDTKKNVQVALDAYGSIDTIIANGTSKTITVPVDGVRGVDGAGINQFSPSTGNSFSRNFTVEQELAADANLKFSLNVNSPKAAEVVAAEGSDEDEKSGLVLLRFDVRAEKDSVNIEDLKVTITRANSGSTATTTTVYLMDGSTVLDSVSGTTLTVTGGDLTFTDVDYVVPADTTRTLSIAVDIADADSTATNFSASVDAGTSANVVAQNSVGDTLAAGKKTGSATGENQTVRNVGLEISLGSKTITRDAGTIGLANGTSSASATFNVTIKAVGGDLWFGTQAASSTFQFGIHKGGADAAVQTVASSTSWAVPSGVVTSGLASGQSFKLAENQSVTIPVTFLFEGRNADGTLLSIDSYAVGLSSVVWSDSQLGAAKSSTFMANKPEWRTGGVTMP